jgi:hypothetical protein
MARTMSDGDGELFRAVIRYPDGRVSHVAGPFSTRGAATAAVNRETGSWRGRRDALTGAVETTETTWRDIAALPVVAPQTPLHSFAEWPKTPRLFRDITVTEKIDGTNAAVVVRPLAGAVDAPDNAAYAEHDGQRYAVFAQSRKRIVTPDADNYGFARWVWDNASELAGLLGPGLHYGEWWGSGIQRRYGLAQGERRFSLFNTDKWKHLPPNESAVVGSVPVCAVPVLYQGPFSEAAIWKTVDDLREFGSVAAPGFPTPEGVCVFHHVTRQVYKVTTDTPPGNDYSVDAVRRDAGKWEVQP